MSVLEGLELLCQPLFHASIAKTAPQLNVGYYVGRTGLAFSPMSVTSEAGGNP